MTGVSRDTSGDEMARAMAEWSSSPEGMASNARQQLWDRRNELREAIENLLRMPNCTARTHAFHTASAT